MSSDGSVDQSPVPSGHTPLAVYDTARGRAALARCVSAGSSARPSRWESTGSRLVPFWVVVVGVLVLLGSIQACNGSCGLVLELLEGDGAFAGVGLADDLLGDGGDDAVQFSVVFFQEGLGS